MKYKRNLLPKALLIANCSLLICFACLPQKELDDPPIITSASYQHTLYNGGRQPIDARAAKDDTPEFIVTYFLSEEAMLRNEGGFSEAPSEVGKYYVRIERPAGNGYRAGPDVKVEYFIQKPLGRAMSNEQ
ncbi:MAG: hypothetical protein LBT01_03280 [Spirochaetaceae bacterium]|nr:hypothetical protein [Spirochaetaceae bacterium]